MDNDLILLEDATEDGTGPRRRVKFGGEFTLGIDAEANLGGGTLTIHVADASGNEIHMGDDYSFTGLFEPKAVTLGRDWMVWAQLDGATGASIPKLVIAPAVVPRTAP